MATYYVSATTGNDSNNGTAVATPKATIGAGENLATSAGDIVYIAPGTYREHIVHGYSGNAANRIYFIGDPDCEIFGNAVEKGIVRITITDSNDLVENEGTAYAVNSNGKDYITWKNVSLDGGSGGVGAYNDNNNTYAFRCATESDHMEIINCITQTFIYGAYYVAYIRDCVMGAISYSIRRAYLVERTIGLSGYACFYEIDKCVNSIAVGGSYGFLYNDYVQNCTSLGSENAFRTRGDDFINDCHAQFASMAFYGGGNTTPSNNGVISSSFGSTVRFISRYGYMNGLAADSCYNQWSNNGDPLVGLNNSTDMQGDGLLWQFRSPTLFNINNMKKIAQACIPIRCEGIVGSTTTDRDGVAGATDFFGNPREMGEPKHVLLHGATGLTTSSRDIGAVELSNIQVTGSVSSSQPGFSIIDEGIFRIPIVVSASSAVTASIGLKHNKGAGTTVKPKFELRYSETNVTASATSGFTTTAAQEFLTGSNLTIQSVTSTAADDVFETISVSSFFDKSYELELLFINQQTGSDSISTFSDLEIT